MQKVLTVTVFLGLVALVTACTRVSMPEPEEGALFYAANCSHCHGATAKGGQAGAAPAHRNAPDLTKLSERNGGQFPRAEALSYIYGDPDGAHLARVMPQFGALMADDLVPVEVDGVLTPTPRVLAALLAYLEDVQGP